VTILPIFADPPLPRVLALILVLGLTFSSCSPTPERESEAPPADPSVLRPGVPVVREIGGRESHTYKLSLESGQYVQFRIDQPGVDVAAKLVSPSGKEVPLFDDPRRLEEPDRLALVSTEKGVHRLVVGARTPEMRPGVYRLKLRELTQAGWRSGERIAAEQAYCQGRRVLVKNESEESRQQSLALFEQAFGRWEKGGDLPGQVDALVQIAEVHNALGEGETAIPYGERALRLSKEAGYREGEARALQALGNSHSRLTTWSEALDFWGQSGKVWEALGDGNRQGEVLQSAGLVLSWQGRFDEAVARLQAARPFFRAAGDVGGEANMLITWAGVSLAQGDTASALGTVEEALALSKAAGDGRVTADALYNLGRLYRLRGEYEPALRYFNQVLAINVRLGARDNEARIRQALGSVYFNLGKPDLTLAEYREALRISREIGDADLEQRLLTNTGWIYQATGDLDKALQYYEQALSLNKGREDPLTGPGLALHNTGVAYTALGRPKEGLKFLAQAREISTSRGERTSLAGTLLEIGTAYQKLEAPGRAASHYREALGLAHRIGNTGLQAECLLRWAELDRNEGRMEQSLAHINESLGIVESARSRVVSDSLRTSFFASKQSYYDFYVSLLMQLEEANPGKYRTEAFEASEHARARSLLDLISEGKIDVRKGIPSELKRKEIELSARLSILQDALGSGQVPEDSEKAVALKRRLEQIQGEMAHFESEIQRQYRHYAEVSYPTPLRLEEVQRLLDDRTALLQYFIGQNRAFLFVVTQEGLTTSELPSPAEISKQVDAFRQVLRKRGIRNLRAYQEMASRLYASLLVPAEGALARKTSLIIAPDGPLYVLPFEALLTNLEASRSRSYQELPYLLHRYAISYVPSASVLEELREPRPMPPNPAPLRFLAFADPVYDGEPRRAALPASPLVGPMRGTLDQLPGSGAEVKRIGSLYPDKTVQLYMGETATEENVKGNRQLENAGQIHFATHAFLNEEHPELSGLALTRSPRSREDGILRVREIFNLRLSANLLTLSACETGLGTQVRGEGMIGLTRAFFYAGAQSLLVSLWPVADRSTPDLMFRFYELLQSTERKSESLRKAKLAMIGSGKYSHPYYWAPFILVGDPH
jgi:CHAT domain-containing protein/tetratricopeptide (TPR) repeat protein